MNSAAVAEVGFGSGMASVSFSQHSRRFVDVASSGILDGPEKLQADQDDGAKLVLAFEERSSRLTSSDIAGLERVIARLESQQGNHLVVFVPSPRDLAARRFIGSRMAVVKQELSKRGISGETVSVPTSEGGGVPIVLWIAPRVLPTTPVEIQPAVVADRPQVRDLQEPTKDGLLPTPLIPGDGDKTETRTEEKAATTVVSSQDNAVTQESLAREPEAHTPVATSSDSNVDVEELWVAPVGQSLRTVLKDWGARAGWTVVWQSDREYPVDAPATFSGDFMKAASQLFNGFATAMPAPSAHFYKGNHVLLVESGEGR